MAKDNVNKTEMIRAELAKDPNGSPKAIAEKLKEYGVNAQYVSTVKNKMKTSPAGKSPAGKSRAVKSAAPSSPRPKVGGRRAGSVASSDKVSLSDLYKAKNLADELGGVDKAKELLNAVAKLS